jgi:hypothetical protein
MTRGSGRWKLPFVTNVTSEECVAVDCTASVMASIMATLREGAAATR